MGVERIGLTRSLLEETNCNTIHRSIPFKICGQVRKSASYHVANCHHVTNCLTACNVTFKNLCHNLFLKVVILTIIFRSSCIIYHEYFRWHQIFWHQIFWLIQIKLSNIWNRIFPANQVIQTALKKHSHQSKLFVCKYIQLKNYFLGEAQP